LYFSLFLAFKTKQIMAVDQELISKFFDSFNERNFSKMRQFCAAELSYFDPMYNLLWGNDVFLMWKSCYESCKHFSIIKESIKDQEDGYYSVGLKLEFGSKKIYFQKMTAHIKVVNHQIAEYSSAFSVHELLKQKYGIAGILFGWNRLMQNREKNNAKKSLIQFRDSL